MDIRQLTALIEVYRCGSFSDAAAKLAFSQSAISKQVSAVESELGVKIFDRGLQKQTVQITPDGEEIIKKLGKIMDSYNDLCSFLEEKNQTSRHYVSLGAGHSAGEYGEISLSTEFILKNPDIELLGITDNRANLIELLRQRNIDSLVLAVSHYSMWPENEFADFIIQNDAVAIPLVKPSLTIGVRKDHPFAERESVCLSDLKGEKLLSRMSQAKPEGYSSKHQDLLHLLNKAGVEPDIKYIDDYSGKLIPMLVKEGLGIMINSSAITARYENLAFVPVIDFPRTITGYFVYLKDYSNPHLEQLIRSAQKISRANGFTEKDIRRK